MGYIEKKVKMHSLKKIEINVYKNKTYITLK